MTHIECARGIHVTQILTISTCAVQTLLTILLLSTRQHFGGEMNVRHRHPPSLQRTSEQKSGTRDTVPVPTIKLTNASGNFLNVLSIRMRFT
jgi:hypothetical protein